MASLPTWKLKDIVECINKMQEEQFDCICFIEGHRGLGKSTLAYKLAQKINSSFNPERDLYFSRPEVLRALATKKKSVVFADEMINVGFNRDFYETDQKLLIKCLNMYRDSFNAFFGCIPKFITLDKQLQGLCKLRLTVVRRGIALVQTQVPSIYTNDPWDIYNNQKIESKWSLKGTKNPRYSQLTTVRGILHFGDLPPDQRRRYERIKEEKRNTIFNRQAGIDLESSEPNMVFYKNLMNQLEGGKLNEVEFKKVCIISGKKPSTVRARINSIQREKGSSKRSTDLIVVQNNVRRTRGDGLFSQNID